MVINNLRGEGMRFKMLIVIVILMLSLFGCGNDGDYFDGITSVKVTNEKGEVVLKEKISKRWNPTIETHISNGVLHWVSRDGIDKSYALQPGDRFEGVKGDK